jgi:hypothetical protein
LLPGSLNAYESSSSEQNHRDYQHCCKRAPRTCKRLPERNIIQQPLNAARERSTAGHADSYPGWARRCREFEQNLRIRSAVGSLFKACAVADCLSQIREFAFEPPSQRAWPECCGIDGRKKLKVEIALANMRALVRQHDAQLLVVPGRVIHRQHNRGTDRDGRPNLRAAANINGRAWNRERFAGYWLRPAP